MTSAIRLSFLKIAFLCVLAAALCSCVSTRAHRPETQPFMFVQMCDPQLGMGGCHNSLKSFEQAVVQVNSINPDFVVICGDLVSRPDNKSVEDFNKIKARFKMPCHVVPGNHDVFNTRYDKRNGLGLYESLKHYRNSFGKDYYAFEHKGYMFICVNTQLWMTHLNGESESHDAWFASQIAAAARRHLPVFIIAHHPPYLNDPQEGDGYYNLPSDRRKAFLEQCGKYGVVAVLAGHVHRIIVNDYNGIQLVAGQATSKTAGSPLGFRLWHVAGERPFKHESVDLGGN